MNFCSAVHAMMKALIYFSFSPSWSTSRKWMNLFHYFSLWKLNAEMFLEGFFYSLNESEWDKCIEMRNTETVFHTLEWIILFLNHADIIFRFTDQHCEWTMAQMPLISCSIFIPHNCTLCQSKACNFLQRRKQLNILDA